MIPDTAASSKLTCNYSRTVWTYRRTTRPSGSASFEVRKRSQQARDLSALEEGADEEFTMSGVCCAQDEADYDSTRTSRDEEEAEYLLHDVTHSANLVGVLWSSASDRSSLRSSVVAKFIELKQRLDHLASLANSTGVLLPEEEAVRYDIPRHYTHTHTHTHTHTTPPGYITNDRRGAAFGLRPGREVREGHLLCRG